MKRPVQIPISDVSRITAAVSDLLYDGNVYAETTGSSSSDRFTLRCRSSKASGARRSSSGRRTVAACWHAHRDVLRAIFRAYPDGRIVTALADYRGLEGFENTFPDTAYHNAGSQLFTVAMSDLCECNGNDPLESTWTMSTRVDAMVHGYRTPDPAAWSPDAGRGVLLEELLPEYFQTVDAKLQEIEKALTP